MGFKCAVKDCKMELTKDEHSFGHSESVLIISPTISAAGKIHGLSVSYRGGGG